MAKRNLPQPFEIDKIRFKDCFTAPSLRCLSVHCRLGDEVYPPVKTKNGFSQGDKVHLGAE